jgi:hypothetical protein
MVVTPLQGLGKCGWALVLGASPQAITLRAFSPQIAALNSARTAKRSTLTNYLVNLAEVRRENVQLGAVFRNGAAGDDDAFFFQHLDHFLI